jgi:hypothetical protein
MKYPTFLGLCLLASSLAYSQTPQKTESVVENIAPTPEQVVIAAGDADADTGLNKNLSFNDWVIAFEEKFQKIGQSKAGRLFFSGSASVRVGPLDPNYGKELALAYERAIFDMQADFVLLTYGKTQTSKRLEFFEDSSTNKEQFPPLEIQKSQQEGRLGSVFEKALTLMGKKLDAELIKQGVPQTAVSKMSIEQKKSIYKNNFTIENLKTAMRSMNGLVPVQTRIFTEETKNGKDFVVGVIAVQSEKTRQFAKDMALKRPTQVRGEAVDIAALLPEKKSEYLNELGLRYTYDEKGRPMLLSYGRWSVNILPDWAPSRIGRAKQNAYETAQANAERSIVDFMNTNFEILDQRTIGSLSEEIAKQVTNFEDGNKKGYDKTQDQVGETIDKVLKNTKADSRGDLRGTSPVKRWEEVDQNGVLHLGVVVTWSYDQLENANAIERSNSPMNSSGANAATAGSAKDESRSSRIINKKNDF